MNGELARHRIKADAGLDPLQLGKEVGRHEIAGAPSGRKLAALAVALIAIVPLDRIANAAIGNVDADVVPDVLLLPLRQIAPFAASEVQDRILGSHRRRYQCCLRRSVEVQLLIRAEAKAARPNIKSP